MTNDKDDAASEPQLKSTGKRAKKRRGGVVVEDDDEAGGNDDEDEEASTCKEWWYQDPLCLSQIIVANPGDDRINGPTCVHHLHGPTCFSSFRPI